MLSLPVLITLSVTASVAQAHYKFIRLAHNGVWQDPLRYIRNNTADFHEGPGTSFGGVRDWNYPTYPTDHPNSVRCGRDNLKWAPETEVLKVKPGDTLQFQPLQIPPNQWNDTKRVQWDNCPNGQGVCDASPDSHIYPDIFHPGPVVMHLSRVPASTDIHSYDGSAEWLKFYTMGYKTSDEYIDGAVWYPSSGTQVQFISKVPKQTPAGFYLLRVDQVYYASGGAEAQLYPSCVHIEVLSETTGNLPRGIRIPEDMNNTSPGMFLAKPYPIGNTYPGGPIWDGETLVEDKTPKAA